MFWYIAISAIGPIVVYLICRDRTKDLEEKQRTAQREIDHLYKTLTIEKPPAPIPTPT